MQQKLTENLMFVSHASDDKRLVEQLVNIITEFLANGVTVKATSIPGTIPSGEDWFKWISDKLSTARVTIFLITPNSMFRPWVWFELGASWERHSNKQVTAIPVCCCLDLGNLPPPLSSIQGISLTDKSQVTAFLRQLTTIFGLGVRHATWASKITAQATKYCTEVLKPQPKSKLLSEDELFQALMNITSMGLMQETALDIFSAREIVPNEKIRELRKNIQNNKP